MHEKIVLLSDFDGTVTDIDTGAYVLSKFANGDWQELDNRLTRGEITFEECLREQFGMINHPKNEILKMVETAVAVRRYFGDVVNCCKEKSIGLKLVSGGLDFCIKHILERNNLNVDLIAPKTTFDASGIKLEFPSITDTTSFSFKDDTVRRYQREGYNVVYVGDGYADYYAIKEANLRFAMKDSVSARLCHTNNVTFHEIIDFEPVLRLVS
jgi:2-hydroxy-3-keto-5-methylthiopentenyl-1-phosphate phosphatase